MQSFTQHIAEAKSPHAGTMLEVAHKSLGQALKHPRDSQDFHAHMTVYHHAMAYEHDSSVHQDHAENHESHVKSTAFKKGKTPHWKHFNAAIAKDA